MSDLGSLEWEILDRLQRMAQIPDDADDVRAHVSGCGEGTCEFTDVQVHYTLNGVRKFARLGDMGAVISKLADFGRDEQ